MQNRTETVFSELLCYHPLKLYETYYFDHFSLQIFKNDESNLTLKIHQDLVVTCMNSNKPCNSSVTVIEKLSQSFGRCYSFVQSSSVEVSGPTGGLAVLFNLESYDTVGLYTPESGLKVFLTPAGMTDRNGEVFVDWSSEINLSPGFDHSISVHPRRLNKLTQPYSQCESYGEGWLAQYNTKSECQRFCLLRLLISPKNFELRCKL